MDEPDREEFEHAGLKCLILRHPELKHLNGYVALPKGHPYYGKGYDDIDVEVHGGLTFAQEGDGKNWAKGYWWVGFDCAHWGDLVPQIVELLDREPHEFETYRNFAYVRGEIQDLAEQLAKVKAGSRGNNEQKLKSNHRVD
jgi:hypothetical protein